MSWRDSGQPIKKMSVTDWLKCLEPRNWSKVNSEIIELLDYRIRMHFLNLLLAF